MIIERHPSAKIPGRLVALRASLSDRIWTIAAVASMMPLLLCWARFRMLFWFGDEWDLLAQLSREGPWVMARSAFGENYVPLLKLIWVGLVIVFHGSYLSLIVILWLTHAVNVLILGTILRRCGFRPAAIAMVSVLVGLPATNLETLAWSIQLAPTLSFSFFLVGLLALLRGAESSDRRGRWWVVSMMAAVCGVMTFSRGVLAAGVLGLAALLFRGEGLALGRARALLAAGLFFVMLAGVGLITATTEGNHQRLFSSLEPLIAIGQFGIAFFMLNPLHALFSLGPPTALQVTVLGLIKISAVAFALRWASDNKRTLLVMLLLLDAGNSALVAVGRYHTLLAATVASRYQYVGLFCFAPILGVHMERILARLNRRAAAIAASLAVSSLAAVLASRWPEEMEQWSNWRGEGIRMSLRNERPDAAVPFAPRVSVAMARQLVIRFDLH
jgi:hypothetical protein